MNLATHREDIYTQVLSTILVHFLKCRKLELIENSIINNSAVSNYEDYIYNEVVSKEMGDFNDCILNIIKSNGNLQIDAINTRNPRGVRNIVSIIIVSADHTDFKKNLKNLINNIDKENKLDECIIIIDKNQFDKKSFIDFILELKHGEIFKDIAGSMAIYNAYPIQIFQINVPQSICVSEHTILSEEEVARDFAPERLRHKNIKPIFLYDPMVIWIGGKPDDVIQIIRHSHSALKSVEFRIVKNGIYTPL